MHTSKVQKPRNIERVQRYQREHQQKIQKRAALKDIVEKINLHKVEVKVKTQLLKLRFCETTTLFTANKFQDSVMIELIPSPMTINNINIKQLHMEGISQISDQIGIKLSILQIIKTVSNRYQLYAHPATKTSCRTSINNVVVEQEHNSTPASVSSSDSESTSLKDESPKQQETSRLTDVNVSRLAIRPPSVGTLVTRQFDGTTVNDVYMVKSTSTQSDAISIEPTTSSTSEVVVQHQSDIAKIPLAEVQTHINEQIAQSQLRDSRTFNHVRRYLAFHHKYPDFGFGGDTKLSLEVQIRSQGLPGNYAQLKPIYHRFLSQYTDEEIESDLHQLNCMIQTERLTHMQRAVEIARTAYGTNTQVIRAAHGYSVTPGRCDPECCYIM